MTCSYRGDKKRSPNIGRPIKGRAVLWCIIMADPIIFSSEWRPDMIDGFAEKAGSIFGMWNEIPQKRESRVGKIVHFLFEKKHAQRESSADHYFQAAFKKVNCGKEKGYVVPSFRQATSDEEQIAQFEQAYKLTKSLKKQTFVVVNGQGHVSFATVFLNGTMQTIEELANDEAVSAYLAREISNQRLDGILFLGTHVERVKKKWPEKISPTPVKEIIFSAASTFYTEEEDVDTEILHQKENTADRWLHKQNRETSGLTKKVFYPPLEPFEKALENSSGLVPVPAPQVAVFRVTMSDLHAEGPFVHVEKRKKNIVVRRFHDFPSELQFEYEKEQREQWDNIARVTLDLWTNRRAEE